MSFTTNIIIPPGSAFRTAPLRSPLLSVWGCEADPRMLRLHSWRPDLSHISGYQCTPPKRAPCLDQWIQKAMMLLAMCKMDYVGFSLFMTFGFSAHISEPLGE